MQFLGDTKLTADTEKGPLDSRLKPVLDEIQSRSVVANRFIDKDAYRIYLCTFWSNIVLEPDEIDIDVDELEEAYDVLSKHALPVLGGQDPVKESFRFIASADGETTMNKAKLTKTHREMLLYFSSMMLDPEGHRRWMNQVRRT